MQVRPREPAQHDVVRLLREPEVLQDLAAHLGRRRRGAREHALGLQVLEERADAQVVRPEIVPPLRDAVRLVDRDERRLHAPQDLDERAYASRSGAT